MAQNGDKTILLVDDEPLTLLALARDLRCRPPGFAVTTAADVGQAVELIFQGRFDLIVTDLVLPESDGFQVLKAAKLRDPQTMVIILTAHPEVAFAIDALRLGADDFLEKPCSLGELAYRIDNCLQRQELQRKVTMYENILPVCSYCKKIQVVLAQDGEGERRLWYRLEEYLNNVQGVRCSHGCCPECYRKVMQDIAALQTIAK